MDIYISYWLFLCRTQNNNYNNPSIVRVPQPFSTHSPCMGLKSISCLLDTNIIFMCVSLIDLGITLCVCVTHLCTKNRF